MGIGNKGLFVAHMNALDPFFLPFLSIVHSFCELLAGLYWLSHVSRNVAVTHLSHFPLSFRSCHPIRSGSLRSIRPLLSLPPVPRRPSEILSSSVPHPFTILGGGGKCGHRTTTTTTQAPLAQEGGRTEED